MNRFEAKSIINAGKSVLKLIISQGGSSNTPMAWLANWENIKAFSDGASIKVRGVIKDNPGFINEVDVYKVVAPREIDWQKVLENGGYGVELTNPQYPSDRHRLVGASSLRGVSIVERILQASDVPMPPHLMADTEIKDPSLIKESWYAEEDVS